METLKPVSGKIMNVQTVPQPSSAVQGCPNKDVGVEAYRRMEENEFQDSVQFALKVLSVVRRWVACDDVRIELYRAGGSEEIRVKITKNGATGWTKDMSLSSFVRSSPVAV